MRQPLATIAFPLFAPADRPQGFAKSLGTFIFDREDAVARHPEDRARRRLVESAGPPAASPCPALVRINPAILRRSRRGSGETAP